MEYIDKEILFKDVKNLSKEISDKFLDVLKNSQLKRIQDRVRTNFETEGVILYRREIVNSLNSIQSTLLTALLDNNISGDLGNESKPQWSGHTYSNKIESIRYVLENSNISSLEMDSARDGESLTDGIISMAKIYISQIAKNEANLGKMIDFHFNSENVDIAKMKEIILKSIFLKEKNVVDGISQEMLGKAIKHYGSYDIHSSEFGDEEKIYDKVRKIHRGWSKVIEVFTDGWAEIFNANNMGMDLEDKNLARIDRLIRCVKHEDLDRSYLERNYYPWVGYGLVLSASNMVFDASKKNTSLMDNINNKDEMKAFMERAMGELGDVGEPEKLSLGKVMEKRGKEEDMGTKAQNKLSRRI